MRIEIIVRSFDQKSHLAFEALSFDALCLNGNCAFKASVPGVDLLVQECQIASVLVFHLAVDQNRMVKSSNNFVHLDLSVQSGQRRKAE